jgi:glutathione synthase/RimK-type ligase-like ATP-grasp enzyme
MAERKNHRPAKRKPTTVPAAWRALAERQAEQIKAYRAGLDRIADALFPFMAPDFEGLAVDEVIGAILAQLALERRADQQRSMIETLSQRAAAADKRITALERELARKEAPRG